MKIGCQGPARNGQLGTRKAKAARKAVSYCSIQDSIAEYMKEVSSSSTTKLKMHADNQERWDTYFAVQGHKLKGLEKIEERKIMSTNTSNMSPNQKAYFVEERRRI